MIFGYVWYVCTDSAQLSRTTIVGPRSLVHFYTLCCYVKMDQTSWTYSTFKARDKTREKKYLHNASFKVYFLTNLQRC